MVSPCACRGTAGFIHTNCLDQYILHYPNRVCDICNTQLEYTNATDLYLITFFYIALVSFLLISSTTIPIRIGLFLVVNAIVLWYKFNKLFTTSNLVSMNALIGFFAIACSKNVYPYMIVAHALLAIGVVMHKYVPPMYIGIMLMTIFGGVYIAFLTFVITKELDTFAGGVIVVLMFLLCNTWLIYHPAMRPIRT